MYHHIKKLMYTVHVDQPDPRFGNMLLEQFGGANGELAAAMQYSIQGINCEDMVCKDLLMDVGTEELSHLEIIGTLARMHLKPMKKSSDAAEHDPLVAIAGGGGLTLCNSMGTARRPITSRSPGNRRWCSPVPANRLLTFQAERTGQHQPQMPPFDQHSPRCQAVISSIT